MAAFLAGLFPATYSNAVATNKVSMYSVTSCSLPVGKAEDETISVVVRFAALGCVVSAGLNYYQIVFGNKALSFCPDPVGHSGAQRAEELTDNSLFAFIGLGPPGAAGNGPAEIIGHAFNQRPGIALRQFVKNMLQELLVLGCAHDSPYLAFNKPMPTVSVTATSKVTPAYRIARSAGTCAMAKKPPEISKAAARTAQRAGHISEAGSAA